MLNELGQDAQTITCYFETQTILALFRYLFIMKHSSNYLELPHYINRVQRRENEPTRLASWSVCRFA